MRPAAVQKTYPVQIYVPFAKVDAETGRVEGYGSVEEVDKQMELVTSDAATKAFTAWSDEFIKRTDGLSKGNVREMHEASAAGRVLDWEPTETAEGKKAVYLATEIVDAEAREKCQKRVYTGFSIGGNPLRTHKEKIDGRRVNVIDEFELVEVSLVDNPACASARFTVVKRAEPAKKASVEEDHETQEDVVDPEKDDAGTTDSSGSAPKPKKVKPAKVDQHTKPAGKGKAAGVVRALLFDTKKFTLPQAVAWAAEHDFKGGIAKTDLEAGRVRVEQRPDADFRDGTFRPWDLADGVQAEVGHLKFSLPVALKLAMEKGADGMARSELMSILPALDALRNICGAIDGEFWEMSFGPGGEDERGGIAVLTAAAESVLEFVYDELQEQVRSLTGGEGKIMTSALEQLNRLIALRKTLTPAQFAKVLKDEDMQASVQAMHKMGHAMVKATYMMGGGGSCKVTDPHAVEDDEPDSKKVAHDPKDEKGAVQGTPGPKGAVGGGPTYDEPKDTNPKTPPAIDEVDAEKKPGTAPTEGEPEGKPVGAAKMTKAGQADPVLEMLTKVLEQVKAVSGRIDSQDEQIKKLGQAPASIGRPASAAEKSLPGAGPVVAVDKVAVLDEMIASEPNEINKAFLIRRKAEMSVKMIHAAGGPHR